MAKKKSDGALPYFKFFVTAWIGKAISDCDLASQGLFINLCAYYWLDKGKLSYSRMRKKFKYKGRHFDELIELGILKVQGDNLVISFLDEQLNELGLISEQNRKAAEIGWNKRKSGAGALRMDSERNADAMPKEEIREEEIRQDESEKDAHTVTFVPEGEPTVKPEPIVLSLPDKNQIFEEIFSDERFIESLSKNFPGIDLRRAWEGCWLHHSVTPNPPEHSWQWRQKLSTWLEIEIRKTEIRNYGTKQSNGTNQPSASANKNSASASFGAL